MKGACPREPAALPIVVDLDGTLTPTDTLHESTLRLLQHRPARALRLPLWLFAGRAALKRRVSQDAHLAPEGLPWLEPLLAHLREQRAAGHRIVLATAADATIAHGVAAHLGFFDDVIASDGRSNLKGASKLQAIRERVGCRFLYAGDSRADLPIWQGSSGAILVGVSRRVRDRVRAGGIPVVAEFVHPPATATTWLKQLRVHQWLKNVLLFVPALTAFALFDPVLLASVLTAFFSFSLAASATYIANDLWDLPNDRAHPRKRLRPLASGAIRIPRGVGVAILLMLAGLALAAALSPAFLAVLLGYVVLTSAYSWVLKRYALIDVIMLALLYTWRILAGSVASGIGVSAWLMAFSLFIFLSLALVKRAAELRSLEGLGREAASGRDYRVRDLAVLWPLGVSAGVAASVVMGLFIMTPETKSIYATPALLWGVVVGILYWQARLWLKTTRDEMHDDPLVYALRDRGSIATLVAIVVLVVVARFVPLPLHSS